MAQQLRTHQLVEVPPKDRKPKKQHRFVYNDHDGTSFIEASDRQPTEREWDVYLSNGQSLRVGETELKRLGLQKTIRSSDGSVLDTVPIEDVMVGDPVDAQLS